MTPHSVRSARCPQRAGARECPRCAVPLSALGLLTALLLLGTGQARAEMVDFSYSWTVQPAVIPGGTGIVTLSAAQDGTATFETTSTVATAIPGATITTNSSAIDTPDSFHTPFDVKLHLMDNASGAATDLTFKGTVSGILTSTTSQLTSTFDSPLKRTAQLGGHVYSVTINPTLAALPSPTSTTPAEINGLVTVRNKPSNSGPGDPGGPPVNHVPEPSTLLLGATAVLGLAAQRALRRRVRKVMA